MMERPDEKAFETKNDSVLITVRKSLYPKDVVISTAQKFTDGCWIEVDKEDEESFRIKITPKSDIDKNLLELLGRRFMTQVFMEVRLR